MSSFDSKKPMSDASLQNQDKNSECYQQLLKAHHCNACARVASDGLIYDAIQLANFKAFYHWYDQPDHHPAILNLCAFWHTFRQTEGIHEACVPCIQLFVGGEHYIPLIAEADPLPVVIKDDVQRVHLKEASIIFDEHFLVTFLAGSHVASQQSSPDYLVHYTVYNKPFLKEHVSFGRKNKPMLEFRSDLSLKTLFALQQFPKRFPNIWKALKQKHEVFHYDTH